MAHDVRHSAEEGLFRVGTPAWLCSVSDALGVAMYTSTPALAHVQDIPLACHAVATQSKEIPMTQPSMAAEPSMTPHLDVPPFSFTASDEALADLRRRVAATRWPLPKLSLTSTGIDGRKPALARWTVSRWCGGYVHTRWKRG
jgi:hypothetical protein